MEGSIDGVATSLIAAALARRVPADAYPSAGTRFFLEALAARVPSMGSTWARFVTARERVDAAAEDRFGAALAELSGAARDELLRGLETGAGGVVAAATLADARATS